MNNLENEPEEIYEDAILSSGEAPPQRQVGEAEAEDLRTQEAEGMMHMLGQAREAVDRAHQQNDDAKDSAGTDNPQPLRMQGEAGNFAPLRTFANIAHRPTLWVRPATSNDLPRLVEIDMAGYSDVYAETRTKQKEIKAMLTQRFATIEAHGDRQWMLVAEVDGQVEGFMTGQPSSETPETFTSWEEATDNGTLEHTYDPRGRNLYVVNWTVSERGSQHRIGDMLIGNMYGSLIKAGINYGLFSSRMPGFRQWAMARLGEQSRSLDQLSEAEQDALADEYFQATDNQGKRLDWQLKLYESSGFKLTRLVRKAFQDPESLDYGVVCVANNPVPPKLRKAPINWLVGGALKLISRSPKAMAKLF